MSELKKGEIKMACSPMTNKKNNTMKSGGVDDKKAKNTPSNKPTPTKKK